MKSSSDSTQQEKPVAWLKLLQEESGPVFFSGWLNLLQEGAGGLDEAVLVLGPVNHGPFAPVATWPHKTPCSPALMQLCEQVMELRRPLSRRADEQALLVLPVMRGGDLYGVLGVARRGPGFAPPQRNWLYWGLGWLLAHPAAGHEAGDGELSERLLLLLDLLMSALGGQSPQEANHAVLSQAAVSLGCDRISLGFSARRGVRVVGLSNAGEFSRKTDLVQALEAAMNEAADQGATLHYPARDEQPLETLHDHTRLAKEHGNATLLTVPFFLDPQSYGALCFEWSEEPPQGADGLAEGIASVMGRVLLEKRLADLSLPRYLARRLTTLLRRLFGPRYLGRKLLVGSAAALVLFFSLAHGDFRVSSDARLEGALHRTLATPFDGFVESAHYRAGQTVEAGAVLATLDDSELRLELARWQSQVAQHEREMRLSQAQRDSAQARVAAAQVAQSRAHLQLTEQMLERTRVTAPFDALITAGDLSQDLGLPVSKGEQLFELAPLEDFRVVLDVSEGDIAHITEGQQGHLVLKAFPERRFGLHVSLVTPVAEARDGKNLFRVEATLDEAVHAMRPGMEGLAKVAVERRRLIWIWTRRAQDWTRLQLWKWLGV